MIFLPRKQFIVSMKISHKDFALNKLVDKNQLVSTSLRNSCFADVPQISVLKNFANFTGKPMLESLFNKVAGLQSCNFIKKRL